MRRGGLSSARERGGERGLARPLGQQRRRPYEDKLDDPTAAGPFAGRLLTADWVASEIGKLSERPRALRVLPRSREPLLRLLDLFPGLAVKLTPLLIGGARRKQRRYKKLIAAGKWP